MPKKMRRLGYGRKGLIKDRREDVEGDAGQEGEKETGRNTKYGSMMRERAEKGGGDGWRL